MKCSVERAAFAAAMKEAARIAASRNFAAILKMVRLEATAAGVLHLQATDMDMFVDMEVLADVTEPGAVCASAALVSQFASAARGDAVDLELGEAGLTLKSGRSRIGAATLPVEEFPSLTAEVAEMVAVDPPSLSAALRFCLPAAADDETRYTMIGVHFRERDEGMRLEATDGHHIHMVDFPGHVGVGGGGILPSAAVGVVLRVFDKAEAGKLFVSDRWWRAEAEGRSAWGKMVDSQFPDLDRILLTRSFAEVAIVDVKALRDAVQIATCGAEGKTRTIVLEAMGEALEVRGLNSANRGDQVSDVGRAEIEATVKAEYLGAASSTLILEALAAAGDGAVLIEDADRALRISPTQQGAVMRASAIVMGYVAKPAELAA